MLSKAFQEIEETVRKKTCLDWMITGGFFIAQGESSGEERLVIEWVLEISSGLQVEALSSGDSPTVLHSVRMEGISVQYALSILQDKAKEIACNV